MRRVSFRTAIWVSIISSFVIFSTILIATLPGANHPPEIEAMDPGLPIWMFFGENVTLDVNASDPDLADVLTFQSVARDAGNKIVGGLGTPETLGENPASYKINFKPLAPGNFSVTVSISDGRGGAASRDFIVEAVVNHQPIIQNIDPLDATTLFLGGNVTMNVSASDADAGHNPTFTWGARDVGNSTVGGLGTPATTGGNPASSQVTFAPTGTGIFAVTATANDGIGGTASHTFNVVVISWDYLELNNGVSNASVVPTNTTADFYNLSICYSDVDVFVLNLTEGSSFEIELRRSAPSNWVTIYLYYMTLNFEDAIQTVTGTPSQTVVSMVPPSLSAGTYYLSIGATGNYVDTYDLTITSTEP